VGTGIGGVIGPQVFSRMINTGSYEQVFLALTLGAVVMIIGGLAELMFGLKAERQSLESIARPLTAADADSGEDESQLSPRTPATVSRAAPRSQLRPCAVRV